MKKYQSSIGDRSKTKIYGFIPVRMKASRLPGKPLIKILNKTMLEHVFERAKMYKKWEKLIVTTCDKKIVTFSNEKNYPNILTSKDHKRALDRVYEAAKKINVRRNDIVVCVQGDEPLLYPSMIKKVVDILFKKKVNSSVLAMEIISKKQFYDKNIVKIVNNIHGEVLYTSRSPIPYQPDNKIKNAKRIHGIFAFRMFELEKFFKSKESSLEIIESCDSNRICENNGGQFVAFQKYLNTQSVDCKSDIRIVENFLKKDKIYKLYK